MKGKFIYTATFAMIVFLSCKKLYTPTLITVTTNILAIDGPIISVDSTFIRLSRSTSLSDTTQNQAELRATVAVENDQNVLYSLTDKGKGLYVLGVTNFDPGRKYRLNVKTSNGKIYQSDFVPMRKTGPVDSVYFEATDDNHILFYLDAHDPANNTRYYRWDYKETWRYVSLFKNIYSYKNGVVFLRGYNDLDISTCYKTSRSNEIFVGSSINQSNDVIKHHQLGGINNTEKIVHGFVLQVRQYALTKEGFEYYQNLRTNTEQLGSLFDPQPSFLKGNIHCVGNPAEGVLGFVSVSTATMKQFNLSYVQIPINFVDYYGLIEWQFGHSYNPFTALRPSPEDCPYHVISYSPASTFKARADALFLKGDSVLFDQGMGGSAFYASKECTDCRTQGGTTTKPSYFPF